MEEGLGEVTASVIIDSDHTWNAYVGDKKVPDTCAVLARFRSSPLTDDKLTDVIKAIDSADLCPGNPDEKFISACKDKGGIVRGARGNGDIITSIDNSAVIDHSEKQYQVQHAVRNLASTCYAVNRVSYLDQHFALWSDVKVMRVTSTRQPAAIQDTVIFC